MVVLVAYKMNSTYKDVLFLCKLSFALKSTLLWNLYVLHNSVVFFDALVIELVLCVWVYNKLFNI